LRNDAVAVLLRLMRPLLSRAQEEHLLERGRLRTVLLFGVEALALGAVERDEEREVALDLLVRAGTAAASRSVRVRTESNFFMPVG
jgi:hypothetical protein